MGVGVFGRISGLVGIENILSSRDAVVVADGIGRLVFVGIDVLDGIAVATRVTGRQDTNNKERNSQDDITLKIRCMTSSQK